MHHNNYGNNNPVLHDTELNHTLLGIDNKELLTFLQPFSFWSHLV